MIHSKIKQRQANHCWPNTWKVNPQLTLQNAHDSVLTQWHSAQCTVAQIDYWKTAIDPQCPIPGPLASLSINGRKGNSGYSGVSPLHCAEQNRCVIACCKQSSGHCCRSNCSKARRAVSRRWIGSCDAKAPEHIHIIPKLQLFLSKYRWICAMRCWYN